MLWGVGVVGALLTATVPVTPARATAWDTDIDTLMRFTPESTRTYVIEGAESLTGQRNESSEQTVEFLVAEVTREARESGFGSSSTRSSSSSSGQCPTHDRDAKHRGDIMWTAAGLAGVAAWNHVALYTEPNLLTEAPGVGKLLEGFTPQRNAYLAIGDGMTSKVYLGQPEKKRKLGRTPISIGHTRNNSETTRRSRTPIIIVPSSRGRHTRSPDMALIPMATQGFTLMTSGTVVISCTTEDGNRTNHHESSTQSTQAHKVRDLHGGGDLSHHNHRLRNGQDDVHP